MRSQAELTVKGRFHLIFFPRWRRICSLRPALTPEKDHPIVTFNAEPDRNLFPGNILSRFLYVTEFAELLSGRAARKSPHKGWFAHTKRQPLVPSLPHLCRKPAPVSGSEDAFIEVAIIPR